jgi:hypothetical protein
MALNLGEKANYDETKIAIYELPSPLVTNDGQQVNNAFEWANKQRHQILQRFEKNIYGKVPPRPHEIRFEVLNSCPEALGGLAHREEVRIHTACNGRKSHFDAVLYLPANATGPIPAFAGLNFMGNHTISDETDIALPQRPRPGTAEHSPRGKNKHRWPLKEILKRGYAVITAFYCDIYPDRPDGFTDSVVTIFDKAYGGSISAWAWGLQRMMDYLETKPIINASKVTVIGHSRLGKAALWAGAVDPRFAIIISNNSGCGGASLSRRRFGETIECFPLQNVGHWFIPQFYEYAHRENELPIDQHMLIALSAPRPVYITSATDDLWADPKGEFLAAVNAAPVYKLFGQEGLSTETMPPPDTSIGDAVGYHIRTGKHDINQFDWKCFLDFADRHFN